VVAGRAGVGVGWTLMFVTLDTVLLVGYRSIIDSQRGGDFAAPSKSAAHLALPCFAVMTKSFC
jgi:hypothetical protein